MNEEGRDPENLSGSTTTAKKPTFQKDRNASRKSQGKNRPVSGAKWTERVFWGADGRHRKKGRDQKQIKRNRGTV